jgi:hypothetical protein
MKMQLKYFVIILMFFVSSAFAQTPDELKLPKKLSEIPKVSGKVAIDGNLAEWSFLGAIFLSDESTQPLDDCSGIFYMMWDEKNLYFAAKVYDDELIQGKSGDQIHLEDGVQFDLDIDRDGDINKTSFSDDDFQIGFSPGNFADEKPEMWGWNPDGDGKAMDKPENAEIASSKFDKGWIIEARIGIDEFNADIFEIGKFSYGMKIGFGRCINDYDKAGEGGVSSDGAWHDTSKMYDVKLGAHLSVEKYQKATNCWGKIKSGIQ